MNGEHVNIFDMSLHAGTLMDLGVYCVYAAIDLFGMPNGIKASASFLNDYVHDLVKLSQASECAYRNVNVEELYMKDVRQEQNYDVIEVEVMVCYDYSTYQNKKLLRQKEMKSKLHFIYSKHKEKIGINQEYEAMTHCKNCGAPVDVIHDEKCPYCDSYYYTKSNIWMLHELREYQQELYGLS